MTEEWTLLDLMDPATWALGGQEAHADLFVAWDALEIPTLSAIRRVDGARFLSTTGTCWADCVEEETALLQAARPLLSIEAWEQVERVLRETYLLPVVRDLEARKENGVWVPARASVVGLQIQWDMELLRDELTEDPIEEHWLGDYATWVQWVRSLVHRVESPIGAWVRVDGQGPSSLGHTTVSHLLAGIGGPHRLRRATHLLPMIPGETWATLLAGIRWIVCMAWFSTLRGEFPCPS